VDWIKSRTAIESLWASTRPEAIHLTGSVGIGCDRLGDVRSHDDDHDLQQISAWWSARAYNIGSRSDVARVYLPTA
jgi:hypothetical protein